jgi:hypothetical protein
LTEKREMIEKGCGGGFREGGRLKGEKVGTVKVKKKLDDCENLKLPAPNPQQIYSR